MLIGIDAIEFYTPPYFLSLEDLAQARGTEKEHYTVGIGILGSAVVPPDQDIVVFAATAAEKVLRHIDKNDIDMVLFATESGVDQSKAAGLWVHSLLDLPARCRVIELKEACYSATPAIRMAMAMVHKNPKSKILVIASDHSRYGIKTPGEPTQGAAAVAMVIAANPRILAIEDEYGIYAKSAMDFWRPNYRSEALVQGKLSVDLYLAALIECWKQYEALTGIKFDSDFGAFCYHTPYPRLAEKGHKALSGHNGRVLNDEETRQQLGPFLRYVKQIGNTYTASMYVGLVSLLDNTESDLSGKRIGLYSYGSGSIGEYFSGIVQPGYQKMLSAKANEQMLNGREKLSVASYEEIFSYKHPQEDGEYHFPKSKGSMFRLEGMQDQMRIYVKS